jgi:hypothetical protein
VWAVVADPPWAVVADPPRAVVFPVVVGECAVAFALVAAVPSVVGLAVVAGLGERDGVVPEPGLVASAVALLAGIGWLAAWIEIGGAEDPSWLAMVWLAPAMPRTAATTMSFVSSPLELVTATPAARAGVALVRPAALGAAPAAMLTAPAPVLTRPAASPAIAPVPVATLSVALGVRVSSTDRTRYHASRVPGGR